MMIMKKYSIARMLILIFVVVSVNCNLFAQSFVHPGLLHTQEDFERMKDQLIANVPAVVQGYKNLQANEWSQSNVGTSPSVKIIRGGGSGENYINAARGAAAAYQNALRWKLSGNVAHAERAIYILNAWASVTKELGGDSNVSLASGLYGYAFANAAELMRDYEGWAPADFKKFQEWMQFVWYPYCIDFLKRRHGTWDLGRPGHYWSNWGLANVLAVMSIGVLCDDVFIYNQGVSYYKYDYVGTFKENPSSPIVNDGLCEFLGNLVPVIVPDDRGPYGYLGQMQESGRDQGHATLAVGLAVDICQIAWNQGDDLYAYMDNRLAAGIEYIAAYNSGVNDLPWTEYWYHDVRTAIHNSWKQLANSESGRGQFRPYWDRILGHYEGIKGVTLNFAHDMRNKVVADAGGSGGTSGGYDHLGYSTLTCTRPVVLPDRAPTSIKTTMVYNNQSVEQGELMEVVPGSTVKLVPVLPDGEQDTGNWQWNTGGTSKDLEIKADSSSIFRVNYINSRGIKSMQLFSIAVAGDCLPDRYTPTIKADGKTYNDTVITVDQYSTLELAVNASSWRSTFKWNNSETSNSIIVHVENEDQAFSVQATNQGGNEATINFYVEVYPIGAGYRVGEGPVINDKNVAVPAGESVILMPVVKTGMDGGTWKWSDGSTKNSLALENIQESTEVTVTYFYDGEEYTLTFNIYVLSTSDAWGYWPMDEGSGNIVQDIWRGNDAQRNYGTWSKGIIVDGISLNGSENSYLKLPNEFIDSLTDFTITIWVKPAALKGWARIWDFGKGTGYNMFLTVSATGDSKPLRFAIKAGGDEQQINCSQVLEIGKWSHVVITKYGNLGIMYVDGEEVGRNANISLSLSDLGMTTQNYIGKSQYPDPMFLGSIDELRIYSRALSKQEVIGIKDLVIPEAPTSLTASVVSGYVELNWESVYGATAYNVKRSEVKGGPYSDIRSGVIPHTYTDKSVGTGTYYYVVSAINSSIEGAFSGEVSVLINSTGMNQLNNESFEVYPNPFKNQFSIHFAGETDKKEIQIMDVNGYRWDYPLEHGKNSHTINMFAFPKGVYFLKVTGNGSQIIRKIVKQ